MLKIVIIEDEKLTAKDLAKTLLAIEPDIEILAILNSVEEAISYFKTNTNIDLIFSDIELGDGLSFEIFEKLHISIPIIFCTAYNKYALDAFKTAGIDYILKPFDKLAVENSLLKFEKIKRQLSPPKDEFANVLSILKQQLYQQSKSVIIHQGDKIIPLNGKDIAFFFTENDYSFAYTFEEKKYILTQTIDTLENVFSPQFFRANRQFLVNRKAVKDASRFFNRKIILNLTISFTEQIVIGKLKVTAFTNWLAIN